MSRRNREKRAAKQKERGRAARDRVSGRGRAADRVLAQARLVEMLYAAACCDCQDVDAHVDNLLDGLGARAGELEGAADVAVLGPIAAAWEDGWTPVDLHELGRRRLDSQAAAYLDEAVLVESRLYPAAGLHPRWRAGLAAIAAGIEGTVEPDGRGAPHVRAWAARRGLDLRAALVVVLRSLALLCTLPRLERILPRPGEARPGVAGDGAEVDAKMLARVRALLAKAEATSFPDEAEALSAKAQELMTRYRLHQAVHEHGRRRGPIATARRLWMDAPYASAKAHLVQAVAAANRCRTVWWEGLGFVTVVGDDSDLDGIELLTTSLLVQANRAMLAAGRQVARSGVARTRSFRQSFLVAYASRIGERLGEVDTAATAAAAVDARLLPVLAARSRVADELFDRLFPTVVQRHVAASNAAGWGAGRAAADLALFDVHAAVAG